MGLRDLVTRMLRPEQTKSSGAGPMIAWSHIGQPLWTPRRYDSLAEQGFRKNVIAYRCVMMIASAAAAVPWLLYDDEGQEVDQHPLLTLLRHPNPLQDGVTFLESVYAQLEIAGNAFVEAVQPEDQSQPVELYVLRPDRMKIIPGPAGLPQGYQYSVNGQVTSWPADPVTGASNILHLKRFHPLDDWYGMAPMEAALVSIDQHNAAGAWNQALLNQGARPSGALVYAPKDGPATLSDDQLRRLREEMSEMYAGNRNAGRPLILEGGLEWKEMSLSPKDMDWLAGRNTAARDIAQAFGVPAQLVGIPDSQTYANMAEARLAFYEDTVLPLITRVIAAFDHWLTPMFDDPLELDFDADDISALADRREASWSRIEAANFLTLNEKREAAGYGLVDGGDALSGFYRIRSVAKGGDIRPFGNRLTKDDLDDDDEGDDESVDESTTASEATSDTTPPEGENSTPPSDDAAEETPASDTWTSSRSLNSHFNDHGDQFDAESPEDYARQANDFYQDFLNGNVPGHQDPEGNSRIYDPDSNTFGSYNPEGETRTFFQPEEGIDYYYDQLDEDIPRGGQVINSLPGVESEDAGGGGGGYFGNLKPGVGPGDIEHEND